MQSAKRATSPVFGQRVRRLFGVAVASLLAMVPLARAADEAPLTCFSTAFEPFVIERPNGEISGIDVDVIREVAQRTGLNIQIGLKPWLRLEQDFRDGNTSVTCGFAYSLTDVRQGYLHYTLVPLHTTEYVLFYRSADIPDYQGLESLRGMRVAVNRGFRRPEAFDQAFREGLFDVFEVTEDSQGFQMLGLGRVDAVLANSDVGRYQIARLQTSVALSASPPLSSMPTYMVFAKDSSAVAYAERVDKALSEIVADGTYQRIFQRYTSKPPAQ
jgi:polar amino acid transport system substrate-binding protein